MEYKTIIIGSAMAFILACFMLPPGVFAITTCLNSTWISTNTTIYDSRTGAALLALTTPDKCPYGCDMALNACRQPQYNMWLGPVAQWGILGLVIFIIIAILVIKKLSH